jgi:hypothetical protein
MGRRPTGGLLALLLLPLASPARAADAPAALPAPAAPADLGRIDFPTSGAPAAQPAFLRGEMLLALEQALRLAPRRAHSLAALARAARELGDDAHAREAEALLGDTWHAADPPRIDPALTVAAGS